MYCMSVTLDVSKLSGWLNKYALCRVEREASEEGRHAGQQARRAWGGCGASSVQARPNCGGCGRGTRGAHVKHGVHGRDTGRVEAQRLVERRRVLPSAKKKHRKRGDRRAGRREGS
eukprot:scaffold89365_cov60-Phaeocystis_antarctica.AAC.1